MIQKAITKYGLAFHLAMLAAIPSSLVAFVSEQTLGGVVLWLSFFAFLWIFIEPSIRPGEHLSIARTRVCSSIVRDPVIWFLLLYAVLAAVRWLNSGMEMVYDPEKVAWRVSEPLMPIFPGSVGKVGFLPFTIAVGAVVLAAGLRHAIGLGARSSFALSGSFIVGMGGFASAVCSCVGMNPFATDALQGFGVVRSPSIGVLFAIWLLVGIGAGVLAEARKWRRGRLFYCIAIGGNVAGLLFFSSPLVAAAYSIVAFFFAVFCLIWLARVSSSGAMVRNLVFLTLGLLLPAFLVMSFSNPEFKKTKIDLLNPEKAWNPNVQNADAILSDVSKRLWLAEPWLGTGLGAYKFKAPFVVRAEEWEVIPPKVERAVNGYWTLISERGNVMCGVMALVISLMLFGWGSRCVKSYMSLRYDEDADAFLFACSPEVWVPLFFLPLLAVQGRFESVYSVDTLFLALTALMALAIASFPHRQKVEKLKEDN